MGYISHHVIIVTSDRDILLDEVRMEAQSIFPWVSEISTAGMNGYQSFFIPPDGSKEGWEDSRIGDQRRERFIAYMKSLAYGDGSNPLDWIEVRYGGSDDGLVEWQNQRHALTRKVGHEAD